MGLITDDNDVEQRVARALRSINQRQYTLAEIEGLAQEYCDDPASKARLDEILRLSLFIEWLRKRGKAHTNET